jgi:hypothetical protein
MDGWPETRQESACSSRPPPSSQQLERSRVAAQFQLRIDHRLVVTVDAAGACRVKPGLHGVADVLAVLPDAFNRSARRELALQLSTARTIGHITGIEQYVPRILHN